MNKITRDQFSQFMHKLKLVLPKYAPDITEATLEAWFGALSDLSIEGLRHVYVFARDNFDAFPSIKMIRDLVDYGEADLPPDPFSELIAAVQTRNFTRHPTIVETARQCGGWEAIGQWQIEAYDHKRRMVADIWKGVLLRWKSGNLAEVRDTYLPPANVMKAIEDGQEEAHAEIKSMYRPWAEAVKGDRKTISLAGWVDEIKGLRK